MQRSLTVTTISFLAALVTGCAAGPRKAEQPTRPTTANVTTPRTLTAINRSPSSVPTSRRAAERPVPATTAMPATAIEQDPAKCARSMVQAIVAADLVAAVAIASPAFGAISSWITEPIDAEVIDIVVLANAGNQTRIGVGVAFAPAADGSITEPIAYIVDVLTTSTGCSVIGLGFA